MLGFTYRVSSLSAVSNVAVCTAFNVYSASKHRDSLMFRLQNQAQGFQSPNVQLKNTEPSSPSRNLMLTTRSKQAALQQCHQRGHAPKLTCCRKERQAPQSATIRLLLLPGRSQSRELLVSFQLKASSPRPSVGIAGQKAGARNNLHGASSSPVTARWQCALPLSCRAHLPKGSP